MLPKFLTGNSFNFPLYALCAGIVAITAMAAGLTYWLLDRNERAWTLEYGQALANLSAHRALDSTLNHDLVSLQVILSDVAENSSVINATIHDVENNLLVQAGRRIRSNEKNHFGNFSAPITLHNSIAGYVTITLDLDGQNPFIGQMMWLFGLLAATLIALALCYGYIVRSKLWAEKIQHTTIPIVKTPTAAKAVADEEINHNSEETYISDKYQVRLLLRLQNYKDLSRQLNNKIFRDLNQRFEQRLQGVMNLYNGQLVHAQQQTLVIQFNSSESDKDATFNGVCAAMLLLKLNLQPSTIPLHLTAILHEADYKHNGLKRLPYYLAEQDDYQHLLGEVGEHSLFAQTQLLTDQALDARLELTSADNADDLVQVVALKQPYQELLEKQLSQLARA